MAVNKFVAKTLMILNKTSGYIDLNLANPVDWSRYIWLSYRVIPVCIPINQFVEGNGQSSEAKLLADELQQFMMDHLLDNFEQDYRNQMSSGEMTIFDSLSFFEQNPYGKQKIFTQTHYTMIRAMLSDMHISTP